MASTSAGSPLKVNSYGYSKKSLSSKSLSSGYSSSRRRSDVSSVMRRDRRAIRSSRLYSLERLGSPNDPHSESDTEQIISAFVQSTGHASTSYPRLRSSRRAKDMRSRSVISE